MVCAALHTQDPAVIRETGLCVWSSGPRPALEFKTSGAWLFGRLALRWTGQPHVTYTKADVSRDYEAIAAAGAAAREAVRPGAEDVPALAAAVEMSYQVQLAEGMAPLPEPLPAGALARKYAGGGWGGYAVFLFESAAARDAFVAAQPGDSLAVEPFLSQA